MKSKLRNLAMSSIAAALIFIAGTGVSPNSWFIVYEPDIPESLKR